MKTLTSNSEKHVFIASDFETDDFIFEHPKAAKLTCTLDHPEFDQNQYDYKPSDEYPTFRDWAMSNLSHEELFEVPMMSTVYYFPSFVDFCEEDRYKVASATTLFYNIERGNWGIAMTGGGMDLSPHLISTFINLEKGIPLDLALNLSRDYSGYIPKGEHLENCKAISVAVQQYAESLCRKAEELK